jgi:hypothetical protein
MQCYFFSFFQKADSSSVIPHLTSQNLLGHYNERKESETQSASGNEAGVTGGLQSLRDAVLDRRRSAAFEVVFTTKFHEA